MLFYEYIYIYWVYAKFVILLLPNLFRIGNWKASRVYEECFDVNQREFDSCKKIPERLLTCPFLSEIFNYAICVKYLLEIYRDVQGSRFTKGRNFCLRCRHKRRPCHQICVCLNCVLLKVITTHVNVDIHINFFVVYVWNSSKIYAKT